MCGRTACTLDPQSICHQCGGRGPDGTWTQPRWVDPPGGQQYYPSYNMAPSAHSPVLMSRKHTGVSADTTGTPSSECEWVIQPMHWGLVPHWHRGEVKSVAYSMNNARSDGILSKTTFKKPLDMGRRCVVLADGYYEWQTGSDGKKQPYFIYFPQPSRDDSKLKLDPDTDKQEPCDQLVDVKPENNNRGNTELVEKRLLTMAGLFDVWRPADGGEPLYSYSVITVDAHPSLAWMHNRMPAILNGDDEVRAWLDFENVPLKEAMELIRPLDCLVNHPVSSAVNNARYKSPDCLKPIDITRVQEKSSGSSSLMKAWLGTAQKRTSSGGDQPPDEKKPKN